MDATKLPRCKKGFRRNTRTKICDPVTQTQAILKPETRPSTLETILNTQISTLTTSKDAPRITPPKNTQKLKRCPPGHTRNKTTGLCNKKTRSKVVVLVEPIEPMLEMPNVSAPMLEPIAPTIMKQSVLPISTTSGFTLNSKISFLFLTYGTILHENAILALTQNHHVYIHPKYPSQVSPTFRQNIITSLEPKTEWGRQSIVRATVRLLNTAYKADPTSEWFVLLSEDAYPMMSEPEMCNFLAHQTKSMFHVRDKPFITPMGGTKNVLWKASQWWIMSRADVLTYIKTEYRYRPPVGFDDSNPLYGAPDEYMFLSLLKSVNPNYEFTNMMTTYTRWLPYTIQKSPATFNRLIDADIRHIRRQQSLFIRKTSTEFIPTPKAAARTLVVVYFGTHSPVNYTQLFNLAANNAIDIVVISAVPISRIPADLRSICLSIHPIIWKFFAESVMNFTVGHCTLYNRIIILSEEFRSNELTNLVVEDTQLRRILEPGVSGNFKSPLPFEPLYVHVTDSRGNTAYLFSNYKGVFVPGESVILF